AEQLIGESIWSALMYRNVISNVTQVTPIAILDASTNYPGLQTALTACNAMAAQILSAPPQITTNNKGGTWTVGGNGLTLLTTVVPPNAPQYQWSACKAAANANANNSNIANSNSLHPGGANHLFVDGSVRFIKSTTNIQTYMALGTRGNGEVVSADS